MRGVTSPFQAEALLGMVPRNHRHLLAITVLTNEKTLQKPSECQSILYPSLGDISAIARDDPRVLNLIHYAPPLGIAGLKDLTWRFPWFDGFEINSLGTPVDTIRDYRVVTPSDPILILRIGGPGRKDLMHLPELLTETMMTYGDLVNGFLLDWSEEVEYSSHDLNEIRAYVNEFHHKLALFGDSVSIGIAGNFWPDAWEVVASLAAEFKNLSIEFTMPLRNGTPNLALAKECIGVAFNTFPY